MLDFYILKFLIYVKNKEYNFLNIFEIIFLLIINFLNEIFVFARKLDFFFDISSHSKSFNFGIGKNM